MESSHQFRKDRFPAGEYEIFQLPWLGASYTTKVVTEGLCGVKNEDLIKEFKEGSAFIFPDLDRILSLTVIDSKTFIVSLENSRWLSKVDFTTNYSQKLAEKFFNIRGLVTNAFQAVFYLRDAILTVNRRGDRQSLWIVWLTCADQFILLFSLSLLQDDPTSILR